MIRNLVNLTKNHIKQTYRRDYVQYYGYKPNAGIRRQAKASTNEIDEAEPDGNDLENLSKLESDFFNTSETYKAYRQESAMESEKLKRHIVRNKYFNEKQLNFLTWAEMEQIRLLHSTDPVEWNEDKLVESFPADSLTIKKVLKANWRPRNARRIAVHDDNVRMNWKSFKDGQINNMNPRFSEHLCKFSTRNVNQKINYDNVLKKELPQPETTEFLGIITSCKKYKDEPKRIESNEFNKLTVNFQEQPTKETSMLGNVTSQRLYNFKPSNFGKDTNVNDDQEQEIIFNNPSGTGIKKNSSSNRPMNSLKISKYETNEVQLDENELKQLCMPSIQEYIKIPAKLFIENATYRLDDCYYDDDGEFLYRVPGMNGGRK